MNDLHVELARQHTAWREQRIETEQEQSRVASLTRWQRRRRRAAIHERLAREALTAAPLLHRPA